MLGLVINRSVFNKVKSIVDSVYVYMGWSWYCYCIEYTLYLYILYVNI